MSTPRQQTQVTWSSASSVTVSGTARVVSDVFTFDQYDWDAELQVWADNQGTPASGDVCNVYIAYTTGDILGNTGDDYVTNLGAEQLIVLDTSTEDPASKSTYIRTAPGAFKLVLSCPQANLRNLVVYARVQTHRTQ